MSEIYLQEDFLHLPNIAKDRILVVKKNPTTDTYYLAWDSISNVTDIRPMLEVTSSSTYSCNNATLVASNTSTNKKYWELNSGETYFQLSGGLSARIPPSGNAALQLYTFSS